MGLLYSIVSYFYPMGSSIPAQKIRQSSQKLSHGLQLTMRKMQKANLFLQNEFITMISKPIRDRFIERVKIDDLIRESIKFGGTSFLIKKVYEQLFYCSERIRNEADTIAQNLSKVSDDCLASIYSIVHLEKDFALNEFIDLKEFIPEPYPVISQQKLQANIRKFLQFTQPSDYERNTYIIEMTKRHQGKVSIMELNKVNHGFVQHPQRPQNQIGINSENLYARSASCQIVQYSEREEEENAQFAC